MGQSVGGGSEPRLRPPPRRLRLLDALRGLDARGPRRARRGARAAGARAHRPRRALRRGPVRDGLRPGRPRPDPGCRSRRRGGAEAGAPSGPGPHPGARGAVVDLRLPRVTVLARGRGAGVDRGLGWAALCRLVTDTHLRGERGTPVTLPRLVARWCRGGSRDPLATSASALDTDVARAQGAGGAGAWGVGAGAEPAAGPARTRLRRGPGCPRAPHHRGPGPARGLAHAPATRGARGRDRRQRWARGHPGVAGPRPPDARPRRRGPGPRRPHRGGPARRPRRGAHRRRPRRGSSPRRPRLTPPRPGHRRRTPREQRGDVGTGPRGHR